MARSTRQSKILNLISSREIDTQEELVALLAQEGYNVTQATVSRDIKELGLIKAMSEKGKYRYTAAKSLDFKISIKLINVFREVVISIVVAGNLLVIKTLIGSANAAAMVVDNLNFSEVLGGVAGDDTFLLVTKDNTTANILSEKLQKIIE